MFPVHSVQVLLAVPKCPALHIAKDGNRCNEIYCTTIGARLQDIDYYCQYFEIIYILKHKSKFLCESGQVNALGSFNCSNLGIQFPVIQTHHEQCYQH